MRKSPVKDATASATGHTTLPPPAVAPALGEPGDETGIDDQGVRDEPQLPDVARSRRGRAQTLGAPAEGIARRAVEKNGTGPARGIGRVPEKLDEHRGGANCA